ncbi:hypothetical protein HJ590_10555 [Naumannella sp. ID2617S]|nr:hypothetical protein [Naumannella sp. ID2617S]
MERFRTGLVDDHFATSMGIASLLESTDDLTLIANAGTVPELLAEETDLDLVLLDLSLADESLSEDNVATLSENGIAALAYTSGENAFLIRSAARAGVRGIARKSQSPDELLAAISSCLSEDDPG